MNKDELPVKFGVTKEFLIPEFDGRPAINLSFTANYEAERRMVEARVVNGATYSDLEMIILQGESEMRTNHSQITYEITRSKKTLERLKSEYLIDEYVPFLKETGLKDSTIVKNAFLQKKEDFIAAQDRIDFLTALESLVEGKIKVLNNVSRVMKKEMDLQIRSAFNGNKYTSK